MVAFPQLLEYATDRIHVLVDCDGNARLVETGSGVRREWTAKVALPHLHAAWAALVQSGFPALPAGDRTLIAFRADGRREGGKIAAPQMFTTLDALIDQIIDDKADAVVTNIVRITS
jgi:hypothetical protein